jgi:hypothetical protein
MVALGLLAAEDVYHRQVALHVAGGLAPDDHQYADEVQFVPRVNGDLPRLLFSWRGHGCSCTKFAMVSIMNGVSLLCPRW